jgi:hypothetical protein
VASRSLDNQDSDTKNEEAEELMNMDNMNEWLSGVRGTLTDISIKLGKKPPTTHSERVAQLIPIPSRQE